MEILKKIGAFLGIALLAVVAFLTGKEELKPKKDPYEEDQKDLENKLQDLKDNGVEVDDLTPEQVEEYWKK